MRADDIRPYKDQSFVEPKFFRLKKLTAPKTMLNRIHLCRGGYHPPAEPPSYVHFNNAREI